MFLLYLTDNRRSEALVSFIILSKGYCQRDRLSGSCHQILNFLDRRRVKRRCLSVGLALVGQAGGKKKPRICHSVLQ